MNACRQLLPVCVCTCIYHIYLPVIPQYSFWGEASCILKWDTANNKNSKSMTLKAKKRKQSYDIKQRKGNRGKSWLHRYHSLYLFHIFVSFQIILFFTLSIYHSPHCLLSFQLLNFLFLGFLHLTMTFLGSLQIIPVLQLRTSWHDLHMK